MQNNKSNEKMQVDSQPQPNNNSLTGKRTRQERQSSLSDQSKGSVEITLVQEHIDDSNNTQGPQLKKQKFKEEHPTQIPINIPQKKQQRNDQSNNAINTFTKVLNESKQLQVFIFPDSDGYWQHTMPLLEAGSKNYDAIVNLLPMFNRVEPSDIECWNELVHRTRYLYFQCREQTPQVWTPLTDFRQLTKRNFLKLQKEVDQLNHQGQQHQNTDTELFADNEDMSQMKKIINTLRKVINQKLESLNVRQITENAHVFDSNGVFAQPYRLKLPEKTDAFVNASPVHYCEEFMLLKKAFGSGQEDLRFEQLQKLFETAINSYRVSHNHTCYWREDLSQLKRFQNMKSYSPLFFIAAWDNDRQHTQAHIYNIFRFAKRMWHKCQAHYPTFSKKELPVPPMKFTQCSMMQPCGYNLIPTLEQVKASLKEQFADDRVEYLKTIDEYIVAQEQQERQCLNYILSKTTKNKNKHLCKDSHTSKIADIPKLVRIFNDALQIKSPFELIANGIKSASLLVSMVSFDARRFYVDQQNDNQPKVKFVEQQLQHIAQLVVDDNTLDLEFFYNKLFGLVSPSLGDCKLMDKLLLESMEQSEQGGKNNPQNERDKLLYEHCLQTVGQTPKKDNIANNFFEQHRNFSHQLRLVPVFSWAHPAFNEAFPPMNPDDCSEPVKDKVQLSFSNNNCLDVQVLFDAILSVIQANLHNMSSAIFNSSKKITHSLSSIVEVKYVRGSSKTTDENGVKQPRVLLRGQVDMALSIQKRASTNNQQSSQGSAEQEEQSDPSHVLNLLFGVRPVIQKGVIYDIQVNFYHQRSGDAQFGQHALHQRQQQQNKEQQRSKSNYESEQSVYCSASKRFQGFSEEEEWISLKDAKILDPDNIKVNQDEFIDLLDCQVSGKPSKLSPPSNTETSWTKKCKRFKLDNKLYIVKADVAAMLQVPYTHGLLLDSKLKDKDLRQNPNLENPNNCQWYYGRGCMRRVQIYSELIRLRVFNSEIMRHFPFLDDLGTKTIMKIITKSAERDPFVTEEEVEQLIAANSAKSSLKPYWSSDISKLCSQTLHLANQLIDTSSIGDHSFVVQETYKLQELAEKQKVFKHASDMKNLLLKSLDVQLPKALIQASQLEINRLNLAQSCGSQLLELVKLSYSYVDKQVQECDSPQILVHQIVKKCIDHSSVPVEIVEAGDHTQVSVYNDKQGCYYKLDGAIFLLSYREHNFVKGRKICDVLIPDSEFSQTVVRLQSVLLLFHCSKHREELKKDNNYKRCVECLSFVPAALYNIGLTLGISLYSIPCSKAQAKERRIVIDNSKEQSDLVNDIKIALEHIQQTELYMKQFQKNFADVQDIVSKIEFQSYCNTGFLQSYVVSGHTKTISQHAKSFLPIAFCFPRQLSGQSGDPDRMKQSPHTGLFMKQEQTVIQQPLNQLRLTFGHKNGEILELNHQVRPKTPKLSKIYSRKTDHDPQQPEPVYSLKQMKTTLVNACMKNTFISSFNDSYSRGYLIKLFPYLSVKMPIFIFYQQQESHQKGDSDIEAYLLKGATYFVDFVLGYSSGLVIKKNENIEWCALRSMWYKAIDQVFSISQNNPQSIDMAFYNDSVLTQIVDQFFSQYEQDISNAAKSQEAQADEQEDCVNTFDATFQATQQTILQHYTKVVNQKCLDSFYEVVLNQDVQSNSDELVQNKMLGVDRSQYQRIDLTREKLPPVTHEERTVSENNNSCDGQNEEESKSDVKDQTMASQKKAREISEDNIVVDQLVGLHAMLCTLCRWRSVVSSDDGIFSTKDYEMVKQWALRGLVSGKLQQNEKVRLELALAKLQAGYQKQSTDYQTFDIDTSRDSVGSRRMVLLATMFACELAAFASAVPSFKSKFATSICGTGQFIDSLFAELAFQFQSNLVQQTFQSPAVQHNGNIFILRNMLSRQAVPLLKALTRIMQYKLSPKSSGAKTFGNTTFKEAFRVYCFEQNRLHGDRYAVPINDIDSTSRIDYSLNVVRHLIGDKTYGKDQFKEWYDYSDNTDHKVMNWLSRFCGEMVFDQGKDMPIGVRQIDMALSKQGFYGSNQKAQTLQTLAKWGEGIFLQHLMQEDQTVECYSFPRVGGVVYVQQPLQSTPRVLPCVKDGDHETAQWLNEPLIEDEASHKNTKETFDVMYYLLHIYLSKFKTQKN